jgi:uncharacterized protein
MKFLIRLLFLLFLSLPANAQDYPAFDSVFVNDFAKLIPPQQEDRIEAMLFNLREDHGIEFAVVTISALSNYGYSGPIEPFATGLFNAWGVGDAKHDDGVMMLVSQLDRVMRIEVGAGYGTRKDDAMKRIIDNTILPEFRDNRYASGIEEGVRAVIFDLTGEWPGENTPFQKIKGGTSRIIEALGYALYPIGAALAGLSFWVSRRIRRYKAPRCPEDGTKMQLLAEHWDDQHLNSGQLKEETLKSVDYDVWECPACEHRTIKAHGSWFSTYGACRECRFRTLQGRSTILERATTTSTGRKRIDYDCQHCHASYSVTKTIPKISKSSSSGSSGSRSFGGGSSSGGGASGRW